METVKNYFPEAPRPAESIEPGTLYLYREKYPKLFAHIVMACVKKQAVFLTSLWDTEFKSHDDPCVYLAWEFIAERGAILDYLDLDDPDACNRFNMIYNAVSKGYHAK